MATAYLLQHSPSSGWGIPHPLGPGEAMPGSHSSCPLGPQRTGSGPGLTGQSLVLQACLSVHTHHLGLVRGPAAAWALWAPFPGWRPLPRTGPLLSARY